MKMKRKLVLVLALSLVISMIPAPVSAALKGAGSPTEVQTLVSGEGCGVSTKKGRNNAMELTFSGLSAKIVAGNCAYNAKHNQK